ncbi:MAG: hypothetical protein J6Z36_03175, partial [Clostridia bacterium]|nr:hypothetical protein [Clostridia bacterium]
MKSKTAKCSRVIAIAIMSIVLTMLMLSSCKLFEGMDFSFEGACKTTEDGFVYYEDPNIGICIIELPDSEEVVIPEYIEGKRVAQLGYKDIGLGYMNEYYVDGSKVKKLTVQHAVTQYKATFLNLEKLIYVDYPYYLSGVENTLDTTIYNSAGNSPVSNAIVELKKSDREIELGEINYSVINIPEYVTKIDSGVFAGLSGVT